MLSIIVSICIISLLNFELPFVLQMTLGIITTVALCVQFYIDMSILNFIAISKRKENIEKEYDDVDKSDKS